MIFYAIENIKFINHEAYKGCNSKQYLVQLILHNVINIALAIILRKKNKCDIDIADTCLVIFVIYCNIANPST